MAGQSKSKAAEEAKTTEAAAAAEAKQEPPTEPVKDEKAEAPKEEQEPELDERSPLDAVNSRLKRTNIKGKDYVEVNQRILGFHELYPNGSITTEILSDDDDKCVVKASAYDGDKLLATGHAFEVRSGHINSTSYIENCETSAVGRALGFIGIGAVEAIASADEVNSAINQQSAQPPEKLVPTDREFIGKCRTCGTRYKFPKGTTEERFKATECCNRPDWVVE